MTYSKSTHERMYVVIAIPAGGEGEGDEHAERQGEHDPRRGGHPSAVIVTRNAAEYSPPRITAQPISPRATSAGDIGVASTVS